MTVPESIKQKIKNPTPNIEGFKSVLKGEKKPEKMYFAELFADDEIMQWVTENLFGKRWVPASDDIETQKKHLLCQIEYWYRMGYDYIHLVGGSRLSKLGTMFNAPDTADDCNKKTRKWANMNDGKIKTIADFEAIQWQMPKDEDLWMYEFVSENLPDGMGIFACPESGFLEVPMEYLIGYESMAMMSFENPQLLELVFGKVCDVINAVYAKVVEFPKVEGFFQGDDMGYKTSTMLSPDFLKKYSLPGHKLAAQIAHKHNKLYFLHSCGCLEEIMDYLIDEVKIDAKQSFEDIIMPVEEFYAKYSRRIAVLGGVDVDILAGGTEEQTRSRTREILEKCFNNGRYAFGSGNTLTNYCKVENILAMFDEAYRFESQL